MKKFLLVLAVALGILAWIYPRSTSRILVITAAEGYRHASTEAGVQALRDLADQRDIEVVVSDDAAALSEEGLRGFQAVVFLNTSGDILNYHQQVDFERYLQAGGGFVGIHGAIDTEPDWGWYGKMIGARYAGHPAEPSNVQTAVIRRVAVDHASTRHLSTPWERSDEWANLKEISDDIIPLLTVDEASYQGGTNGATHPVAWYHAFEGGRVFYTAGGHTPESFSEDAFLQHLGGGLDYAIGKGGALDYTKATTRRIPEEDRFTQIVLADYLDEPTEFELLPGGDVLFLQRKGEIKLYDAASDELRLIDRLDVHTVFEDGLMGLALDPNYEQNHWIYLYYSVPGEEPKQRLSRFEFQKKELDRSSEITMLEVRTQRDECCHTGGSIEFGPDGNLFLSTGDNTNPFASDGYSPSDERAGRAPWDAQGSSANTNDLRGKILRIRPQPDGSYTIPEGNLFPEGDPQARPEIYVMGNRNPYRINIDQKTGFLYWGEVGPDAGDNHPERGPRGHDEVNQAREAGFFGWPYFVGDNKAYRDYNFESGKPGPSYDPAAPANDSPNNTGRAALPPAQKAFIWYPYADSPEFPILGNGGRNAMAGPVFYADRFKQGAHTFPDYFDEKLFIFDWIRGWINVVTMNEDGDLLNIDPFMPATRFHNPIDMMFDAEGVMYLLEYGTGWFSQNPDARLSRIEYNPGNRKPVAVAQADKQAGAAPLTVHLSADGSRDADGDVLQYAWRLGDDPTVVATTPEADYSFPEAGVFHPTLIVTDPDGQQAVSKLDVRVGNEPPRVTLAVEGNQTFFFDGTSLDYQVSVLDREDGELEAGTISPDEVFVQMDYLEEGYDKTLIAQGHQQANVATGLTVGKRLVEDGDCQACHTVDRASIGPSFNQVAQKYTEVGRNREEMEAYLVEKIIQGGGGVWGEQAMAAHPQLTNEQAASMVAYILSLAAEEPAARSLPVGGQFVPDAHTKAEQKEGMYFFRAVYTDRGTDTAPSSTGQSLIVLRHPRVEAESFDTSNRVQILTGAGETPTYVSEIYPGSYIGFEEVDLAGIQELAFRMAGGDANWGAGIIELVLDDPGGEALASATVKIPGEAGGETISLPLPAVSGQHDLYIRFATDNDTGHPLFMLDWIRFR